MKSTSTAAAGQSAFQAVPPNEVAMPITFYVERAPKHLRLRETITIRRDGEADLQFEGWLLFKVRTEPPKSPQVTDRVQTKRWKQFALYTNREPTQLREKNWRDFDRLIVAEEGHSDRDTKRTRYSATVCRNAIDAWIAMGKIEELKEVFSEYGLPIIKGLND